VYREACQALPSAAICPVATQAAFRDVPAHADPDEYRWASLRAVAQKVDSPANSLFHRGPQIGGCTAFPDRLAASDASAGPGAVLRRSVARFPASFQGLVRDYQLAMGAQAPSDAHRARQVPQPPDGRTEVESQPEPRAVVQKALLAAAHQVQSSHAPLATADASVWPREVSLQTAQRE
jgi:hypothetical protein